MRSHSGILWLLAPASIFIGEAVTCVVLTPDIKEVCLEDQACSPDIKEVCLEDRVGSPSPAFQAEVTVLQKRNNKQRKWTAIFRYFPGDTVNTCAPGAPPVHLCVLVGTVTVYVNCLLQTHKTVCRDIAADEKSGVHAFLQRQNVRVIDPTPFILSERRPLRDFLKPPDAAEYPDAAALVETFMARYMNAIPYKSMYNTVRHHFDAMRNNGELELTIHA